MYLDFKILKRLYKSYTKKYLRKILISLFFTIILAGSTSAVAYLLDPAIDQLFINQNKKMLFLIPGLIILAFATKGASLYLAKVLMIAVSQDVKRDMQVDMFNSIVVADTGLIDKKHSGKFIANLNNDINMITNLLSVAILNLFKDSFTLIALLGVMFYQNWKLSLIAIIMIPLASGAARTLGKRMGKVTIEQMVKAGDFMSYLVEILKNHRIIKIFQTENYEKERARKFLEELKLKGQKIAEIMVRASPIMEFLTGIMIAILIYYSGNLIMSDELALNNFFSFLAAMMLAYQPVRSLATVNMLIYQGAAAAQRVFKIIDREIKIKDDHKLPSLQIDKSNIKFENVSFQYETGKERAIKNISIDIEGEKITALVGHSGAGKSTILNLIPRFYEPQGGKIYLDSQEINKVSLKSLRDKISLVSQDVILFDDSVENNIKYAKLDATEQEVKNACKLAAADEFIDKLPNKYKTLIGENAIRLSGGQKQRISIARAILKNSPIILLDEATSSLDADSEEKVQNAIFNLTKNRTTLVIAHRLSTINKADKIILMKDGNVLKHGTHSELLKNSKEYESLYKKQMMH